MSWQAIRAAYAPPDLTTAQRIVLVTLAYRCNPKTGQCNPGMTSLARDTGMDVRSVRRVIRTLEDAGILITRQSDGGRMQTNAYQINPDLMSSFDGHKPGHHAPVSKQKPGHRKHETRTQDAVNPDTMSSEPLRTVLNRGRDGLTPEGEEEKKRHFEQQRQKLSQVRAELCKRPR